jgi:drug/metabolite transporter (DMT)-like permease
MNPIRHGVLIAGLAALLFGATAPVVKEASALTGTFSAGSLLYLGAGLASTAALLARRGRRSSVEAPLRAGAIPRLLAVALLGAVLAPAALVAGLRTADAASGSLLLALEAPLTLLIAWLLFREHVGWRAVAAMLLIFAGSLVLGGAPGWRASSGLALVALATLCWALDNALSRALADLDPVAVVAAKGTAGACASALVAVLAGEPIPPAGATLAILLAGAAGYGLSLQLYLRAQRTMGAARTASVFAASPFVGVLAALALGTPWPGSGFLVALALVAAGIALHAAESHRHAHRHATVEHEHAHRHDDGHHDHRHDQPPPGPHSHLHRHEPLEHEHDHGEDLHHLHVH